MPRLAQALQTDPNWLTLLEDKSVLLEEANDNYPTIRYALAQSNPAVAVKIVRALFAHTEMQTKFPKSLRVQVDAYYKNLLSNSQSDESVDQNICDAENAPKAVNPDETPEFTLRWARSYYPPLTFRVPFASAYEDNNVTLLGRVIAAISCTSVRPY